MSAPLGRDLDPEGDRRVVTVMFADVTGSTTMGERLDPEEITEIMNRGFDLLLAEIKAFGGTIGRLMGDGLIAFFGAPEAHEDDPERAIRAGMAMQAVAVTYREEVRRRFGVEYQIRVGINTGEVVAGQVGGRAFAEYTVMGDTVNTAARLESNAPVGGIRVGPKTHEATRHIFEFGEVEHLTLKGKAEPFPTYRVVGLLAERGESRGFAGTPTPLVGRATELERLRAVVDTALAGPGAVVRLSGEPGAGKSRLLTELRRGLERPHPQPLPSVGRGDAEPQQPPQPLRLPSPRWGGVGGEVSPAPPPRWIVGRCFGYRQEAPYSALSDLLDNAFPEPARLGPRVERARALLTAHPSGLAPEVLERGLDLLAELSGEAGAVLAGSGERAAASPRDRRDLLIGLLRALVAALAAAGPAVIVLEDAHWLDTASGEVLGELLGASAGEALAARTVLLVTHRPEWTPPWTIAPTERHIVLDRLSEEQARDLAESLLVRHGLAGAMAEPIAERAGGNPFFIEELVRAAAEHPATDAADSVAGRVAALPMTVQEVVLARADRLGGATRAVLQVGAVCGRAVSARLLGTLAGQWLGLAPATLDEALTTLERQRFLTARALPDGEGGWWFTHALTQDAVYESLLMARRRQLHGVVGRTLERLYHVEHQLDRPIVEDLARHFARATDGPEDRERATRYLVAAGRRALGLYANQSAEDYFRQAVRFLHDGVAGVEPARLVDALDGLGQSALEQSRWEEAETAFGEAVERLGLGPLPETDDAEAPAGPPGVDLLRGAALLRCLARTWRESNRYDRAIAACRRGFALIEQLQPDHATPDGSNAPVDLGRAGVAERLAWAWLRIEQGRSFNKRTALDAARAAVADAVPVLESLYEGGADPGSPDLVRALTDGLDLAGLLGQDFGDDREAAAAEAAFQRAIVISDRTGNLRNATRSRFNLARFYRRRKQMALAQAEYAGVLRFWEQIGNQSNQITVHLELAALHLERSEIDAARDALQTALEIARRIGDRDGAALALRNLGVLYHRQGDLDRAVAAYEEARQLRAALGDRRGMALCLRSLGVVHLSRGELDAAESVFREALATFSELNDRRQAAEAHVRLGEVHQRRGDYAAALAEHRAALAIYRQRGERDRIAQSLRQTGLAHLGLGDLCAARAALDEALALRRELDWWQDAACLHVELAGLAAELGDLPAARAHFAEARAMAERQGDTVGRAMALAEDARLAADLTGAGPAEALASAHEAVRSIAGAGSVDEQLQCELILAGALLRAAATAEPPLADQQRRTALDHATHAAAEAERHTLAPLRGAALRLAAEAELALGRPTAALARAEAAVTTLEPIGGLELARAVATLAAAGAATGSADASADLARARDLCHRFGATRELHRLDRHHDLSAHRVYASD